MRCPNCQAENPADAAFCGSCGTPLAATPGLPSESGLPSEPGPLPAPKAAAAVPPPPAPTVPMPAAGTQSMSTPVAAPTPEPVPPQPQPGQPAVYGAPVYPQAPQGGYAQPGAVQPGVAQPPRKRKTGLIVGIIIIVLLLLCGCVVAGLAMFTPVFSTIELIPGNEPTESGTPVTPPSTGTDTGTTAPETPPAEPVGFATPDEAAAAALAGEGLAEWVYQVYEETDASVVYWAGPPASEWAVTITVDKAPDGSWGPGVVGDLDLGGGDVSEGELTPYDQAVEVVGLFLSAVKEDRGLDAQALTVDPFHSDSASAQMAAGMLASFEVVDVIEQSDGTFWVKTAQNWDWGVEQWQYWVVPTEAGYFIADVQPW